MADGFLSLGNMSPSFSHHGFWSEIGFLWISFSPRGKIVFFSLVTSKGFFFFSSLVFRSLLWCILVWISLDFCFGVLSTSRIWLYVSFWIRKVLPFFSSGAFSDPPALFSGFSVHRFYKFHTYLTLCLRFCLFSLCCSVGQFPFLSSSWSFSLSHQFCCWVHTSPELFILVHADLGDTVLPIQTTTRKQNCNKVSHIIFWFPSSYKLCLHYTKVC